MSRLAEIMHGDLEGIGASFDGSEVSFTEVCAAIARLAREVAALKSAVLQLKRGDQFYGD